MMTGKGTLSESVLEHDPFLLSRYPQNIEEHGSIHKSAFDRKRIAPGTSTTARDLEMWR